MKRSTRNSHSARWSKIRTLEDALAVLAEAEQLREQARIQVWNEGDLAAAFWAMSEQKALLDELRQLLSDRWNELYDG